MVTYTPILALVFAVFCGFAFETSVNKFGSEQISCEEGATVYIDSANYTCQAECNESCDRPATRDVRLSCQGSYDVCYLPSPIQTLPCGNDSYVLNVSWHCQNMTSMVLQEGQAHLFRCDREGDIVAMHVLYWMGFTVPNITMPDNNSSISPSNTTGSNTTQTNNTKSSNQTNNALITTASPLNASECNSTTNDQTTGAGGTNCTMNTTSPGPTPLNFSVPLPDKTIWFFSNPCHKERTCTINVTTMGDPYPGILSRKSIVLKSSCQPVNSGYTYWTAWNTCPEGCGVLHFRTRRRSCRNPKTSRGGSDCSGRQSETLTQSCTKACAGFNYTVCDGDSIGLVCPYGTFINFDTIFYGRKSLSLCTGSLNATDSNCTNPAIETHNSVRAWEKCQMRRNCTLTASNGIFQDACPGFSKYLYVAFHCTPVVERIFCHEDTAKISCPGGRHLVLHEPIFYGRESPSVCSPAVSKSRNCSGNVQKTNLFCNGHECNINMVNGENLKLGSLCPDVEKYVKFRYSCQTKDSYYRMWGAWASCEACGLHARKLRTRQLNLGDVPLFSGWHGGSSLSDRKLCHLPCQEHDITTCASSNDTIVCPKFGSKKVPTVIEVRSVFYGRTQSDVCPTSFGETTNCTSLVTTKKEVMTRCQGRTECSLGDLSSLLTDPCTNTSKYLNMTYRCQSVFTWSRTENYYMQPKNLTCYDDMIIVPHDVYYRAANCPSQATDTAFQTVKERCEGKTTCKVENKNSYFGDPCPGTPKRFSMWYSCQTAAGGLDTNWGPWSQCTECGLYSMRTRRKPCINNVTHTTGAHCPLVQQQQNCQKPCPITKLKITNTKTSFFAVVLGNLLKVKWEMMMGTNVTVLFSWGDNSTNTTLDDIQANATNPLRNVMNYHNYTEEGEYSLLLYASNVLNNLSIMKSIYVQVKLEGLNVSAPMYLAKNQEWTFHISLQVISKAAPTVDWTFGDGMFRQVTNFTQVHSYSKAGNFTFKVKVYNRVSALTFTRTLSVQENITGLGFSENVYNVSLNTLADVTLIWTTGSHLLIYFNSSDNSSSWHYAYLKDTQIGGLHLRHKFQTIGYFQVFVLASNQLNRESATAHVLVEIAITGFNATITCHRRFADCFENDTISVWFKITNGSNPHFTINMGDGTIQEFVSIWDKTYSYSYNTHGLFQPRVVAYNNATKRIYQRSVNILRLSPLGGLIVACNYTVSLGNITICRLTVANGSAYECTVDLRDGSSMNYTYETLPTYLTHQYANYGIYTVILKCNNSLGAQTARYTTVVSGPTLGMSLSNDGPMMKGDQTVFTVHILNTPPGSCFLLDVGDNRKLAYGDQNCSRNTFDISNVHPLDKSFSFNHTYSKTGIFVVSLKGKGNLITESVNSSVTITERPCNIKDLYLSNIGKTMMDATRLQKSREFVVRSRYDIQCQDATGAGLEWEILIKKTDSNEFLPCVKDPTTASQLMIKERALDYGMYKIKLIITLTGIEGISSTVEGYVNVVPTPLVVIIKQGTAIRRDCRDDITIDGSESRDPDQASTSNNSLDFSWYCYVANSIGQLNITQTSLSSVVDNVTWSNAAAANTNSCAPYLKARAMILRTSSITLNLKSVEGQGIFVVELRVREGNRRARTTTVIELHNSTVPVLYISCKHNCRVRVNPHEVLSFSAHCSSNCYTNMTKSWSLFIKDSSSNKWTPVTGLSSKTLTQKDKFSFVLKKQSLHYGRLFAVRLTVWENNQLTDVGQIPGLTEYQFNTSIPPRGGFCEVTPNQGIAMETMFSLVCTNWTIENEPTLYKFGYKEVYTDLNNILYIASIPSARLQLPAGHPNEDSILDVVVFVVDNLGVSTTWNTKIKVTSKRPGNEQIDKLVMRPDSKLDFYINIEDVESATELVSGVLSLLNYEAFEQLKYGNLSKEAMANRTRVRTTIIIKMCTISTTTLEAIKQVSVTLASSAQIRNEVAVTALAIGTSKLEEMAHVLINKSLEDTGITIISEAAKDLMTAGSNFIMSAAYVANVSRKASERSSDIEQCKGVVNTNMATLDVIARAVFITHVAGQEDVTIITTSTVATYRVATLSEIGEKPIKAGETEAMLPSAAVLLPTGYHTRIDIQMLMFPENPYTWDETSAIIHSPIINLKLTDPNGHVIAVNNLAENIELSFNGVPGPPKDVPEYYKPSDNSSMQYHAISYKEQGESISLNIRPVNSSDTFIAFVKYGSRPTEDDFELYAQFPNFSSCIVQNGKAINCSSDPNTLLISSDELKHFGLYYVGIKYTALEQNQENTDAKSRQRRDCERSGRSKRSCIKYKDPPPTLPGDGQYGVFQKDYNQYIDRNYTMGTENIGCRYWDLASNTWTTKGCKVGRRQSSKRRMSCSCDHLTSFGGSFFVAPNPIDLDQVWMNFLKPQDNIPIIVTMCLVFGVFLLVLVWARRADNKDERDHTGVVIMHQSDVIVSHNYLVTINTSQRRDAGTTANVFALMTGERGESGAIPISTTTNIKFTRGSQIQTTVCLSKTLGPLLYVHIWHDNSGVSPAWFLDDVIIRDVQSGNQWVFVCDRWIAVENEECRTDTILYVAGSDDLNNYKRIFVSKTSKDLYDGHLWFSVVAKPPTSSFTRVQRCCCCLSLLLCTMVSNCMFYNIDNTPDNSVIMIGPLKVSIRQLMIGFQSGIIVFPVNLLLVALFRKSMGSKEKGGGGELVKKLRPGSFMYFYAECFDNYNNKLKAKCRLFFSGRFLYYFSWFLFFISSAVSAIVTIMYSIQWKKDISEKWCISFFTSFLQDAFVIQPVKVAAVAAFVAFIVKENKRRKGNQYETLRNADVESPQGTVDEKKSDIETNCQLDTGRRPPNKRFLENARKMRIKQIKTTKVVKEIVFYFAFLLLIMAYAYGHRDPIAFKLTKEMVDLTRPIVGTRVDQFWSWLSKQVILDVLFVGPWYNGQSAGNTLDGFISDRNSFLVGMARLRQLRVKEEACPKNNPLALLSGGCYPIFSLSSQDDEFYKVGWKPLDPGTDKNNVSLDVCPLHWRYQSALSLEGLPVWAVTNIYPGGGYVAELGYYTEKALHVLNQLHTHSWIDHGTRAILLEFVVYNAQKNLFSAITIVIEFLPNGGMIPYSKIDTMQIYRYISPYAWVLIATELIIVLVIVFLLYQLLKKIYRERKEFFRFFWNWINMFQVLLGLISISLYFVKLNSINSTMDKLRENPLVFVNFQLTILWNDVDVCLVAGVVFLTTVKFLRLLKYQVYIKLLDHVFARFSKDMSWFMLEFVMWLMPFVMFANIVFGTQLEDFHSILSSFQSTINALLGATYFHDLNDVDRVMGPLLFAGFNLLLVFILMNMFVSIINASFERPVDDQFTRETNPQLLLFISDKIQAIFGMNIIKPSGLPINQDSESEASTHTFLEEKIIDEDKKVIPLKNPKRGNSTRKSTFKWESKELRAKTKPLIVQEKMGSFYNYVSRILLLDEIEDTLFDMVLLRRGDGPLQRRFNKIIHVAPLIIS